MEMDRTLQYLDRTELEKPKAKKIIDLAVQLRAQKALQMIEKLKELTGAERITLHFIKDKAESVQ